MIQANELRIGNYVIAKGEIEKVDDVLLFGINLHHDCWEFEYKDIKPIELTEEILLKCGFSNFSKPQYRWLLGDFKLDIDDFAICFMGNWLDIKICYLHQLQNLYFALTNTELKINL